MRPRSRSPMRTPPISCTRSRTGTPPISRPGLPGCAAVINKDAYAKLPPQYQKLLQEAQPEAYKAMIEAYRSGRQDQPADVQAEAHRDPLLGRRSQAVPARSPANQYGTSGSPTTRRSSTPRACSTPCSRKSRRPKPRRARIIARRQAGANRSVHGAPTALGLKNGARPLKRGRTGNSMAHGEVERSDTRHGRRRARRRRPLRAPHREAHGVALRPRHLRADDVGVVHVLGRKFFNMPILGYIDIVEIMMAFMVFLAIAYTERLGGHIRMELFVS